MKMQSSFKLERDLDNIINSFNAVLYDLRAKGTDANIQLHVNVHQGGIRQAKIEILQTMYLKK